MTRIAISVLFFLVGFALLARFDVTVSGWLTRLAPRLAAENDWTGGSLLRGLRAFAEPVVLVVVVFAVAVLDPRRKRAVTRLLLALLVGMILFQIGKKSVDRTRPGAYAGTTWHGMWNGVDWEERPVSNRSFPSGHTTTAFAFGLSLAALYPRLRWLFVLLAVGCGLSRVIISAHWPSDCWTGAWIGITASWIACRIVHVHPQNEPVPTTT
jgi:membrane-associated phospholipid phosphatase